MMELIVPLSAAGVPAGIAALIVLIMVVVDRLLKHRAETYAAQSSGENRERELLSADQEHFRAAILKQLTDLNSQVVGLQRELQEAREAHLECEKRSVLLETELARFRMLLSPSLAGGETRQPAAASAP